MIFAPQANPATTIDNALTGQQAKEFYRTVLAIIKVMVLLIAHLLGLAATALQALSQYYKDECHEGLLKWAQSTTNTEASIESAGSTVINQMTPETIISAAPQLTASTATITVSYKGFNSKMLRQLCEEFGVQWRNVHGKGKHLKVQEMKTRIDKAAIAGNRN